MLASQESCLQNDHFSCCSIPVPQSQQGTLMSTEIFSLQRRQAFVVMAMKPKIVLFKSLSNAPFPSGNDGFDVN